MRRRDFPAGPAVLIAGQSRLRAQTRRRRELLASLWTGDQIMSAANGAFHPFPVAGERAGPEALRGDARYALIAAGERRMQNA
jgi:hypothetical protein